MSTSKVLTTERIKRIREITHDGERILAPILNSHEALRAQLAEAQAENARLAAAARKLLRYLLDASSGPMDAREAESRMQAVMEALVCHPPPALEAVREAQQLIRQGQSIEDDGEGCKSVCVGEALAALNRAFGEAL